MRGWALPTPGAAPRRPGGRVVEAVLSRDLSSLTCSHLLISWPFLVRWRDFGPEVGEWGGEVPSCPSLSVSHRPVSIRQEKPPLPGCALSKGQANMAGTGSAWAKADKPAPAPWQSTAASEKQAGSATHSVRCLAQPEEVLVTCQAPGLCHPPPAEGPPRGHVLPASQRRARRSQVHPTPQ